MTDYNSRQLLKNIFGYDHFLPLQEQVIAHTLSGKDTLVIMPTGGGKSLCYQLPALIRPGLTIVVSPLISLMKDQVEQLHELGIESVCLNSSLSRDIYRSNVESIKNGKAKLLYVAPETLLMPSTLTLLKSIRIDCLTIDEAHCISEWGHDFRPEYRQIATLREQFPDAVCMALTATATPRVQHDISTNLKFKNSDEFIASFNRTNLFLDIAAKTDAYSQVTDFIRNYPDQSGIIYCLTRKQVDDLSIDLEAEGYSVKPYHAGLPDQERSRNQELFIKDDVQIIVATIAFGMGINKPNVRFVIHHDLPKNIESYYQQIGRAGRDGLQAHCLLLFSYGDLQRLNYFITKMSLQEQQIARHHLNKLVEFAESNQCRRIPLLSYFGENYSSDKCEMCDNCLDTSSVRTDITVHTQMVLSCMMRTGQKFGAVHIINILRGSRAKKIFELKHQKLSVYGIGSETSKKQWGHLVRQMMAGGLIDQDPVYGSLKITSAGTEVLQGRESFSGTLIEDTSPSEKTDLTDIEYNSDLFDILRSKRKQLADKSNVPPYVIFSDKSLIHMASGFPETEQEFLQIHGVGRAKLDKYGINFLDLINNFCKNNNIQRSAFRARTIRPSQKTRRFVEVSEKYNNGSSIKHLMDEYNVRQGTILAHLYKYLQHGYKIRIDDILKLSRTDSNRQEEIFTAFDDLGCTQLRPVFDYFDENISWGDLHIQRLCYLAGASPDCCQTK